MGVYCSVLQARAPTYGASAAILVGSHAPAVRDVPIPAHKFGPKLSRTLFSSKPNSGRMSQDPAIRWLHLAHSRDTACWGSG